MKTLRFSLYPVPPFADYLLFEDMNPRVYTTGRISVSVIAPIMTAVSLMAVPSISCGMTVLPGSSSAIGQSYPPGLICSLDIHIPPTTCVSEFETPRVRIFHHGHSLHSHIRETTIVELNRRHSTTLVNRSASISVS